MATIKAFTDLEQSRKLAKILPLESADMAYYFMRDSGTLINPSPFVLDGTEVREDGMFTYLNCWSLAALLGVISDYTLQKIGKDVFVVYETGTAVIGTNVYDNPVDACVVMIERLHELNLL